MKLEKILLSILLLSATFGIFYSMNSILKLSGIIPILDDGILPAIVFTVALLIFYRQKDPKVQPMIALPAGQNQVIVQDSKLLEDVEALRNDVNGIRDSLISQGIIKPNPKSRSGIPVVITRSFLQPQGETISADETITLEASEDIDKIVALSRS